MLKDRYISVLFVLVIGATCLSSFNDKEYSVTELRDLYGSGDPSLWPQPILFDEAKEGFQDIGVLPPMNFPDDNPYSEDKAELGKRLFFDSQLSSSGKVSCASCHLPQFAFADRKELSVGHNDLSGVRNAITVINSGYTKTLFWDGRAQTLEEQVKHPIENPVEMNFTMDLATKKIIEDVSYAPLFEQAFGSRNITEDKIAKAIATYQRTLVSSPSRFEIFISGKKDEFSNNEIKGLHLFRTKANCINCHNTPLFSDQKFHNLGLEFFSQGDDDLGRYDFTQNVADQKKFKTPSLRENGWTKPYMHNGLFPEIRNVLMMYNVGMGPEMITEEQKNDPHFPRRSQMIKKLNLSDEEISYLQAFLRTLNSYSYTP